MGNSESHSSQPAQRGHDHAHQENARRFESHRPVESKARPPRSNEYANDGSEFHGQDRYVSGSRSQHQHRQSQPQMSPEEAERRRLERIEEQTHRRAMREAERREEEEEERRLFCETVFAALDVEGNGYLGIKEFEAWIQNEDYFSQASVQTSPESLLSSFDRDGDGKVSEEDFVTVFSRLKQIEEMTVNLLLKQMSWGVGGDADDDLGRPVKLKAKMRPRKNSSASNVSNDIDDFSVPAHVPVSTAALT